MMQDTLERLDREYLEDSEPEDARLDSDAPFRIDSMDKAEWASYKAREAHREIQAVMEWKRRAIERIELTADENMKAPQRTADFMEAALGEYVLELAREGRGKKSIALPGGTVQLRKRPEKMTTDEGMLLRWLKANGHTDYVKTKESVDNSALKKHLERTEGGVVLTTTGELVEGVDLADQPDSVSFSPNLEERGDG